MKKYFSYFTLILLVNVFAINSALAISYVNVQDYGAVGNGTTDDTSSIQSALSTGNPVYFPKTSAYYKISSALTYSGHRISSNGATIKADDTTFNLLTISNSDGVYVGDLRLEYPNEQEITSGSHPLTLLWCSNFIVERVIAKNGGAIRAYNSNNGVIRKCQALQSSYKAFEIRSSNDILVKDCYAEKNVSAFSTEDSYNLSFVGNSGEDSHGEAIRVEDSENVLVENNLLKNSKSGFVAYGPRSDSTLDTTDIEFSSNTLYKCYRTLTNNFDSYVNSVCEFALATKMHVDYVSLLNNIVIGGDESILLSDFSSNVVFNTNCGLDGYAVYEDHSYYTLVPDVKYAYLAKNDGQMPIDWLFYVNFPSGVDISNERILTVDAYWGGGTGMDDETLAVNLYSSENRTGFICSIPLYNPYEFVPLSCILRIPDNVNVSSVKCIEIEKIGGTAGVSILTFSEIYKGLKSKVGYLHAYSGTSSNLDAELDSNVFVDVDMSYVYRKRGLPSPAPTIVAGTGITGTTVQRPSLPNFGAYYYDTDLDNPIYWDGSDWMDINTYWLDQKVNRATYFDGSNYVSLGNDERVDINNYTIEGWIKTTTNNTERHIIARCNIGTPNGYLMQLWTNNNLCAYQSVGGNFYAAMVSTAFPDDNEFHHVATTFSYNGTTSTIKLYIDGVLKDTDTATGTPDAPPTSTEIKCGDGFEGTIDKIKFHTRTLNATEIAKSYNRFKEQQYAYWRFDENTGTDAYDSSTYGSEGTTSNNIGTLTNMNTSTCWVTGKEGKGLSFVDATNDYVDFGNPSWMNVTNYTISGWIKPTTSSIADRHIIQRCDIGAPSGYLMLLWTNNLLCAYQSVGGNFYTIMCAVAFPHDSEFHHVAMTFSYNGTTSTLNLYIDGNLVDSGSATGAPDTPPINTTLKVGYGRFDGVLDEIKFYSRTLDASEIEKEYLKNGKW
jgi:Concanavalin A-like lectin/glucanases superfamily/Right handed beta helix region